MKIHEDCETHSLVGFACFLLQRDVSASLETCGNTHWATDIDVVALATELNLSFSLLEMLAAVRGMVGQLKIVQSCNTSVLAGVYEKLTRVLEYNWMI